MKHALDRTHVCYAMSKDNESVLTVDAGDTVEIKTYDCFQNQITSADTDLEAVDWSRSNPATGPIYVDGVKAGDVLKVTIHTIELESRGLATVGPGRGVMGDFIEERAVKLFDVDQSSGHVFFNGLMLPLGPMIGVIGVAPENEPVKNSTPGRHGGNMDSKKITEGAVLYLPVFHDGALFGLGDVHAKMGDGEVGISGLEIGSKVTVTLEKAENVSTDHPFVIDRDGIHMMVSHESLDVAVDESVKQMIALLRPRTGLSLPEITMLMSLAGEAQINQVVDPLKTARFFVPTSILEHYDINFR